MREGFRSSYDSVMRFATTWSVALLVACGDVHSVIVVNQTNDASASDSDASAVDAGPIADGGDQDAAGDADGAVAIVEASVDPVFGTAPFVPGTPGQNANAVPEHASSLPLQGKNCFAAGGCHAESNRRWGFAGTVYDSYLSNAPGAKNAEVRIVDSTGAFFGKAYTDDDGNFWFEGAKPPAGSRVGVRALGRAAVMTGAVAGDVGGACNASSCHGGGNVSVIYLP